MRKKKEKSCVDCLHCKVSAKSIVDYRLCFCEVKPKKINRNEDYWIGKAVCKQFEDMSA